MKMRVNHFQANPEAYRAMQALERFIRESGLDRGLYELIKLRASQLNGCSFCVDMHAKEMLRMGEPMERIVQLSVWRETTIYSEAERAVLELTECATRLSERGVPDDVYARVREHFGEKEFVDLLMAINVINSWNRLGVASGMFPGCV